MTDAGAAGSKCGGHGYRGCGSGGVGRQRTVRPTACHTLGPVTGEGRRSEKAPVPGTSLPAPSPHCSSGEPWVPRSREGMQWGVRSLLAPVSGSSALQHRYKA